jgi:hypothetical protein
MPPAPKLPPPTAPRTLVESPKGKEQRLGARRSVTAAPSAIVLNNRTLSWKWTPDADNPASNVIFLVHTSQSLSVPAVNWPVLAICTSNSVRFTLDPSLPATFFYVQAVNTNSGLVSVW